MLTNFLKNNNFFSTKTNKKKLSIKNGFIYHTISNYGYCLSKCYLSMPRYQPQEQSKPYPLPAAAPKAGEIYYKPVENAPEPEVYYKPAPHST
jgi:hypothetical protein